jgi:hypothetical protein
VATLSWGMTLSVFCKLGVHEVQGHLKKLMTTMNITTTPIDSSVLIECAHVDHLIFIAQHPHTTGMRQGDKHSLHCLLFIKNCPLGKYLNYSNLARMMACRYCLSMHVPHEHILKECGCAEVPGFSNMASTFDKS